MLYAIFILQGKSLTLREKQNSLYLIFKSFVAAVCYGCKLWVLSIVAFEGQFNNK